MRRSISTASICPKGYLRLLFLTNIDPRHKYLKRIIAAVFSADKSNLSSSQTADIDDIDKK